MIHHYSIAVNDTKKVADILSRLFEGSVSEFAPYKNSYMVWLGDEYGTAIEVYPDGTEMMPDTGDGQANFVHNATHSGFTATHAAISIKRTREEIYPWRLRFRLLVCVIFISWQGEMTSNSRTIARNFNAAME